MAYEVNFQLRERECQNVSENIALIRLQQDKKAKETLISTLEAQLQVRSKVTVTALVQPAFTSGKSYKGSTIVNYSSRVVIWDICKSGTTIES